MKVELDQIQKCNDGYVAYVRLVNNSGTVIATASVPYKRDPEELKEAVKRKFSAKIIEQVKREAEKKEVEAEIIETLGLIDITKEVTK